ncbi:Putative short chain dehydrogenase/reductase [Mycobacteroides abscessus]|nr:Putative short chain dehydrogenase/reductase [Mycobacteroides abscessus]
MDINGSVAIVTGAGSGIGQALAWGLVDAGATVVASDIDADAVGRTAAARDGIVGRRADASAAADIEDLIALAEKEFGPVDLYAANAGIAGGLGLDIGEAAWDLTIDVNLRAHIRAATLLVPGWVERGRGYFLSVASAAGLLTQIGSPAYSVTKHAAVGFAEWLSITYGGQGIGVSCLCPMGVKTALLDGLTESDDPGVRVAGTSITAAGDVSNPRWWPPWHSMRSGMRSSWSCHIPRCSTCIARRAPITTDGSRECVVTRPYSKTRSSDNAVM